MSTKGQFIISLDFELYWGMFDKVTLKQYGENVAGVHTALPKILEYFAQYKIHATWATVGMLMYEHSNELFKHLPPVPLQPKYGDMRLSAYDYLSTADLRDTHSKYYFGKHLVEKIVNTPYQELASHTFSHYYTQDGIKNGFAVFGADCDAFANASAWTGAPITSIVFPRNQITKEALETCSEKGFTAYRGTPNHFLYTGKAEAKQTNPLLRALRLLDTYLNLTGHHTHKIGVSPLFTTEEEKLENSAMAVNRSTVDTSTPTTDKNIPVNRYIFSSSDSVFEPTKSLISVPGSWFLRPYNHTLRMLEWLKIRRIKNAMTYAAKNGELYHLWWHPHNFGKNQDQNFKNLEAILNHFAYLKKEYGMESMNMKDATNVHRHT